MARMVADMAGSLFCRSGSGLPRPGAGGKARDGKSRPPRGSGAPAPRQVRARRCGGRAAPAWPSQSGPAMRRPSTRFSRTCFFSVSKRITSSMRRSRKDQCRRVLRRLIAQPVEQRGRIDARQRRTLGVPVQIVRPVAPARSRSCRPSPTMRARHRPRRPAARKASRRGARPPCAAPPARGRSLNRMGHPVAKSAARQGLRLPAQGPVACRHDGGRPAPDRPRPRGKSAFASVNGTSASDAALRNVSSDQPSKGTCISAASSKRSAVSVMARSQGVVVSVAGQARGRLCYSATSCFDIQAQNLERW